MTLSFTSRDLSPRRVHIREKGGGSSADDGPMNGDGYFHPERAF